MARGANDLVQLVVVGALGYVAYDFALKGKLGKTAKSAADQIQEAISPGSRPGPGGGTSPAPSGTAPTQVEIQGWASRIGLPLCVGTNFVDDFGRLPNNVEELVAWGNTESLRDPNTGAWSC